MVYCGVMSRTNIDLNDELVAEAMARYGLRSKREVVEFALRRLVGEPMSPDEALTLEGSGWEGDLDQMRASRVAG
jgi:Arc/MetJ family transcription regulator